MLLAALALLPLVHAGTLNQRIPVPANDPSLNAVVHSHIITATNDEMLHESFWWAPVATKDAFKETVVKGGRLHTSYELKLVSAKTTCSRNGTPLASLRACAIDPTSTERQRCKVKLGMNEDDKSTTKLETLCTRSPPTPNTDFPL